ncbi:MAG: UvrD-helicase domain-containing protein, partial [Defluviitaleaceae bacterium]|nr:UvrD-helicase domain-containing protein [Defluviitaleaceae bacterium]
GKNLIVFGPAGSGKTSVGLHRLAYLLYHRRESLSPKNVLVISSNYVFSSYISHILPDLGEDEIPQIIFSDILKEFLPRNFAAGDFYAQAERLLAGGDISQMAAICSAEFLTHMEKFFADFRFAATDVVYEDETIITKAELEQDLNENYAHLPFKSRLSRLFEIVRGRIDDYFAINENAIKSSIRKRNAAAFREAGDDVPADFHSELARAKKEGQRALRRGLGAIGVYKRILRGFHKEIYSERLGHIDEKRLYFEDLLAIACIKIHMGEAAFAGHIRHVLVDEAQDFNILQHYILRHMFPQSRFTLLGDINQGLFPALRPDSAALAAIYGAAQTEEMRLTRSYRSTIPINRLAARFIDDSPDYFARDGEPPLLVIDTDFTNAAADLLKSQIFPNAKTICLLTKTAAKARECYNALKSSLPIKIIENEDADLTAGIWVAPAMLAKGLEFDAVIFSDHEKTADSQTDRLLTYLLCTRALHNLAIIAPPENAQKWRDMII